MSTLVRVHQKEKVVRMRWWALIALSVAQLMISVDSTIVNIALPSAQRALGISAAERQWVLTAYLLAFGGLLLFGGRVADRIGRKRAFLVGVGGFALASLAAGAAQSATMLLGARALQGVFASLLAPAALSLLAVLFTDSAERARALGVFSAIAGSGAAVGLIAGGALTQYASWRWALLVNLPVGLGVLAAGAATIHDVPGSRNSEPVDVLGAVLVTSALMSLIYALSRAQVAGWGAPLTLCLFALAGVLLATFAGVERRESAPLLPPHIVADRNRGGVYLSQALSVMAMFGLLLFLTYDMQTVQHYSALITGVAFLPLVAGMVLGATVLAPPVMARVAQRVPIVLGCLLSTLGMLILTQLSLHTSYAAVLLPGQLVFGLGLGLAFAPSMHLATHKIDPRESGIASATINASQQIGGAIGAALLNTLAASATARWLESHHSAATLLQASVRGYVVDARWASGIAALAAVVGLIAISAPATGQAASTSPRASAARAGAGSR